jgi:outer membrane protein assembly factor BamB
VAVLRGATLILAACFVASCGCRATGCGKATMFTRVWTFERGAPYHDGVLRYSTLGQRWSLVDGQLIETMTGAAWLPQLRDVVAIDATQAITRAGDGDHVTGLATIDLATGASIGQAALADATGQPIRIRAFDAGLLVAGDRFVVESRGDARAFDVASGREAWSVRTASTRSAVAVSGDLIALAEGREASPVGGAASAPAQQVVVVDRATGIERWRAAIDGGELDVVASPRGGFFVPRGGQVIELAADGHQVRAVRGEFGAADGELLVVRDGADLVVIDGGGAEVDRVKPAGAGDFVSAPGLCGRALVYFRNRDATVWWHPASGAEVAITKIGSKAGIVDGGWHTAGATLTEPPRCVGGLVLIQDWKITAYRIPT